MNNTNANPHLEVSQSFPFMLLPPEIRCNIYPRVLASPWPIPFFPNCYGNRPAILWVCKLVNKEATPIFYTENVFEFSAINISSDIDSEGPTIHPPILSLLRHVIVNGESYTGCCVGEDFDKEWDRSFALAKVIRIFDDPAVRLHTFRLTWPFKPIWTYSPLISELKYLRNIEHLEIRGRASIWFSAKLEADINASFIRFLFRKLDSPSTGFHDDSSFEDISLDSPYNTSSYGSYSDDTSSGFNLEGLLDRAV